jgi:hypothetical protein
MQDEGSSVNEQTGWSSGFDVLLGNPPWEKIKLLEKEWFSTRSPVIANAKTASARRKAIAMLAETDLQLFEQYANAARTIEAQSHFIRTSSRFPLCGVGEINTFAAFAEGNTKLISKSGRSGNVLPPGICTDDTYKQFVSELLDSRTLIAFYAFTNRGYIFRDVESTLSFSLLIVGRNEEPDFEVAAKLWQVAHLIDEGRLYKLSYEEIRLINPNTRNLPIFESKKDALLVSSLHRRFPILSNESNSQHLWDIHFQRMFDMSNDSEGFETYEALVELHGAPKGNVFHSGNRRMLPLYESKLVDQFNHRASTFEGTSTDERFRTRARTNEVDREQLASADYQNIPRYWVSENSVSQLALGRKWLVGFRNAISAVADSRSVVVAVVPMSGVGNSMPLFYCGNCDPLRERRLMTTLNSFVADYLIRQKASGGNLNYYILKQLAIPNPATFSRTADWDQFLAKNVWLDQRVLELIFASWDLEAFAMDCEYDGPPFRWDDARRFQIRCELDAAYFHLYFGTNIEWQRTNGNDTTESVSVTLLEMFPAPRDAVSYIMDTFPVVRRKDEAKHGEYRTKRVILEIYDQMTEIIEANEAIRAANPGKSEEELRPLLRSYQSPLNPPPGPPTDANGNFIPYADWTDEIHRQYAGVIHPQRDADQVSTILKNSTQREGDNG